MSYLSKLMTYYKRYITEIAYKNTHRRPDVWLFGEWFGKRNGDNSLFLANYVAENFKEISVYWVSRNGANIEKLNKRIIILGYDSSKSFEIFKMAGVVCMNQGYVDFSSSGYNYFRGAITLNLWHGVAWKKIGHDSSKKTGIAHCINMHLVDYFDGAVKYLSTSREYTKVLNTAFHAKSDQIIKAGYPRNRLFYSAEWLKNNREAITNKLSKITTASVTDFTKIIVYMPTFRDKSNNVFSLDCLLDDQEFTKWLIENDVIILQKAHFINASKSNEFPIKSEHANRVLRVNDIESYEALGCADILITDYSSCFFDFLILNRPIIHFIYDYETYKNDDRGVYYDKKDVVCGKTPQDLTSLKESIKSYIINPSLDSGLRIDRKKEFMEYETPSTCEIIVDYLNRVLYTKE